MVLTSGLKCWEEQRPQSRKGLGLEEARHTTGRGGGNEVGEPQHARPCQPAEAWRFILCDWGSHWTVVNRTVMILKDHTGEWTVES